HGAVNPKSFWYSSVSRIGVPCWLAGAPDASPIPPYPHESLKTQEVWALSSSFYRRLLRLWWMRETVGE
ncbi:MAG: hypothetical protein ACYDEV_08920, partial [Acidiferrobacter sp.]